MVGLVGESEENDRDWLTLKEEQRESVIKDIRTDKGVDQRERENARLLPG